MHSGGVDWVHGSFAPYMTHLGSTRPLAVCGRFLAHTISNSPFCVRHRVSDFLSCFSHPSKLA